MENIPDNIVFTIATNLSIGSLFSLALTCFRYKWLLDDNLLFQYLYQRDFAKYISTKGLTHP